METYLIVRYIHFVAILIVVSSVIGELVLLDRSLPRRTIDKISRLDGLYGVGAIVVVAAGLAMWLWLGKPAEYYSNNWIFLTKFSCFIVVGLLSIIPTVFFNKQRKGDPTEMVTIPPRIRHIIVLELVLLFLMPLMATLMAHGYGVL